VEGWKIGKMENWKVENWRVGGLEGLNSGKLDGIEK